jgi:hypothetical protein
MGLFFKWGNDTEPQHRVLQVENTSVSVPITAVYCDASYAVKEYSRRSPGAYIAMYRNTPVDWNCKMITGICLSSTEAELKNVSNTMQRMRWFRWMLIYLELLDAKEPLDLFCDNQSSIKNLQRPSGSSAAMVHIEKHYYYVQDMLDSEINLKFIPGKFMMADIGRKILPRVLFERFSKWILVTTQNIGDKLNDTMKY